MRGSPEIEQRLDDLVETVDLLLDDVGASATRAAVALGLLEQLHRRPDDAEWVADLVGNAGGELTHGRESIGP